MRTPQLGFLRTTDDIADFVSNTWRPAGYSKDGKTAYDHRGQVIANAQLSREQWEYVESEVIARARQTFGAWANLESRGLTSKTTLAEWLSTWRVASEVTEASVSMDFSTRGNEDKTDVKRYSVPIPLIYKGFKFGRRELLTAAQTGQDLETFEALEAAEAVAEKAEDILINGDTSNVLEGNSIAGLRTLSGRYTASGTGDFGALSNIYPTFLSMITNMSNHRFNGPFGVEMNPTQYNEMLEYYFDGTGQRALDRVLALPQIEYVAQNDLMPSGQFVAVQLDKKVIDIREAMPIQVRRWEDPSGNNVHFVVIMAARVDDYFKTCE